MIQTRQNKAQIKAANRKYDFQPESLFVFDLITGLISGKKNFFFDLGKIGEDKMPA